MRFWLKIGLLLALIWALAAGAVFWARSAKPTAQSVAAFARSQHLDGLDAKARAAAIKRMADMLNGLNYDERQALQREGTTRDFVLQLHPDEQGDFLDATLPAGFKQMMESFNRMEPAKRKRILDAALADMKKQDGEAGSPQVDERLNQRFIDQGMKSFYSDASAEVKLDMAPLIEQIQKNLQRMR